MQQEKKCPVLPADDAVQNWFEENIDKECSASSAIYKFRLWLQSLQVTQHPAGCEWVKAHKGLIPDGVHNMKLVSKDNVVMRGTGLVKHNTITLITFLNKTTMGINELPKDYEGVYWLSESPSTEGKLTQSRADLIREANNRDLDGAGEDWIDVNDRLPYKDGDSSVYCLVNDTYDGIVVRPFNEVHECWDQEDGDDYYTDARGGKITHWKPLPELPKRKPK
jgi:hypothetical protein